MTMFFLQSAFLLLLCFLGGYVVARLAKRRMYSRAAPRTDSGGSRDATRTGSR